MADPRQQQGTGFVNYNDVLNANQNSGKQLGTAVGQGLESQAGAVNSNLAGQQSQFKTGLDNANQDYSNVSKLANTLATNSTKDLSSGDYSNLQGIDGTNAAQSGQALQNYNYNGPTGLKDSSGLQSQAQSASQVGQLAGTAQGQQQLLKQYVGGNNNYTSGMGSFDQALLNKYGQGDVNQAKQSLSGINTNVNNAINNASTQANTAQNYVNSDKNNLLTTITNNLSGSANTPGILGQATQNENKYVNNGQTLQNAFNSQNYLNNGTLTADQQAAISGLLPNVSQYGIDTNQAYNMNTAGNSQTAQAQAVAALFNSPNSAAGAAGGQYRFNDPNQFGAANLLNSFIGNGQNAITNNQNQYFNPDSNTAQVNNINAMNEAYNKQAQNVYNAGSDLNAQAGGITAGTNPLAQQAQIGKDIAAIQTNGGNGLLPTNNVQQTLQNYGITQNANTGGYGVSQGVQQNTQQQYASALQNYLNNAYGNTSSKNSVGDYLNGLLSTPTGTAENISPASQYQSNLQNLTLDQAHQGNNTGFYSAPTQQTGNSPIQWTNNIQPT